MENAKHTPAPWSIEEWTISTVGITTPSGLIAEVMTYEHDKRTQAEGEANARLIAAAPELLEELKSALFYIETFGGEVTSNFTAGGNGARVKAIIAKAEGK